MNETDELSGLAWQIIAGPYWNPVSGPAPPDIVEQVERQVQIWLRDGYELSALEAQAKAVHERSSKLIDEYLAGSRKSSADLEVERIMGPDRRGTMLGFFKRLFYGHY